MRLKNIGLCAVAGAIALALAPSAKAATVFPVGSPNFFLTSGTPTSPSITAVFFDGFSASGSFDDIFQFTIPQNGVGSGGIETSFSGGSTLLTITSLLINGTPYVVPSSGSGQSLTVGGIPITAFGVNTIEVIGTVTGSGSYTGNATFQAVPEPATWLLTIAGLGMIGGALRRRRGFSVA